MPPQSMSADERLMAAYQEAALRLNRLLAEARTPSVKKQVLARINALINELDTMTAEYIQQQIPIQFKEGSSEAIAQLRKVSGFSVDDTFSTLHTEALQALADDATLKFANALQSVKNGIKTAIRQSQKQQILSELITSEITGDAAPQKRVKILLEQSGAVGIQTRSGLRTLEDYSSMLTHTILAEAHNTGAATRYISNGIQYATVIERTDAPDATCQWMRGKVVWLGDRRLLNPYHPRCYGGIKPFIGEPVDPIRSPDDPRIPSEVRKMLLRRL